MVKYSKKRSSRKKRYSKRRYSKKRYSKKRKSQKGGVMKAVEKAVRPYIGKSRPTGEGADPSPEKYKCKFVFSSSINIDGVQFNNNTEYIVKWVTSGYTDDPMPFSRSYEDIIKLMARLDPGDLALNIKFENIQGIVLSPNKQSIDIILRDTIITCTIQDGGTAEHLFDKMMTNLISLIN